MIKKTQLAIFAAMVLSCSVSYGQFTPITPSSLGLSPGQVVAANTTFNIGGQFGQAANAVQLLIGPQGANVSSTPGSDLWTVSSNQGSNFRIISATAFDGFIQHGGTLGSPGGQNSAGGVSFDGFTAAAGEDWTLVSNLDNDYNDSVITSVAPNGSTFDSYRVTYVGGNTGNVESNSSAFRYESDQAISAFTVNTSNNSALVNNFSFGIQASTVAIPEPTGAALIAFASTFCLMRRRRS